MLLIYSQASSPRLDYVVQFIFASQLAIPFSNTTDFKNFAVFTGPKLNYSSREMIGVPGIVPHSLLFEDGVVEQNIVVMEEQGKKMFFQTASNPRFSFDIFAATFFLISRYEEYLPSEFDEHGRFQATNSLAFRNGFLEEPIIETWTDRFRTYLTSFYPNLFYTSNQYSCIPTIDIDNAFAYQNKGVLRTIASSTRALVRQDKADFSQRIKVLKGVEKDPYDTYDYINEVHHEYSLKPLLFFLFGNYGKFDKNISREDERFCDLISTLSERFEIGAHPSYESNNSRLLLNEEIIALSKVVGKIISKSRQHFLKITMPSTYQNLISAGIQEDYSMGYASHCGFRAGTCRPFYFYDLAKESGTALKVFPFQVLDVGLKNYQLLAPEEALQKIDSIIKKIKAVNGTFIPVWHNESLSGYREWASWSEVYSKMLQMAI